MQNWSRNTIILLLSAFLISACSPEGAMTVVNETDEPSYRRGKQELRANHNEDALNAFLKVIDKRRRQSLEAPESHFEVGRLYLEYVKDPIYAIYYLREYLRLVPDSPDKANVEEMIKTAQKEFAKTLPGKPYNDAIDRLDLMDLLKQVRAENVQLKQKLATARQQVGGVRAITTESNEDNSLSNDPQFYAPPAQSQSAPAPTARTNIPSSYTVKAGDSLYKISAKVYGNGKYWKKIFDHNQDVLPSVSALQPGMLLKIPQNID